MKPYKTDKTGEDILELLSKNSRITADDIARQLGIAEEKVKKYVQKFEKDRIVLRYKTQINWERIKQHEVRALIEVKEIGRASCRERV